MKQPANPKLPKPVEESIKDKPPEYKQAFRDGYRCLAKWLEEVLELYFEE